MVKYLEGRIFVKCKKEETRSGCGVSIMLRLPFLKRKNGFKEAWKFSALELLLIYGGDDIYDTILITSGPRMQKHIPTTYKVPSHIRTQA